MVSLLLASAIMAANPTLGFGVGQHLDRNLLSPSLFTMRIVAGDRHIISPGLTVDYSGTNDDTYDTEDYHLELGIGAQIHRAIWKAEENGLYAILGPQVEYEKRQDEYYGWPQPDSLYSEKRTTQRYYLNLGLGMEYFLKRNLSVCVTTLSGMGLRREEREYRINGRIDYVSNRSTRLIDLQTLDCAVYIVWYL